MNTHLFLQKRYKTLSVNELMSNVNSNSKIVGMKFSGKSVSKVFDNTIDFKDCIIEETDFSESNFKNGANFKNCIIIGVKFNKTQIKDFEFQNTYVNNIEFKESDIDNIKFHSCELDDVFFNNSKIIDLDLTYSKVTGDLDLSDTILGGLISFEKTKALSSIYFNNASKNNSTKLYLKFHNALINQIFLQSQLIEKYSYYAQVWRNQENENKKGTYLKFAAEEFALIKNVYNKQGFYKAEDRMYRKQKKMGYELRKFNKHNFFLLLLEKLFVDIGSGYLTKLRRTIAMGILFILVFSLIYYLNANLILVNDQLLNTLELKEQILYSLYFSGLTFVTISFGEIVPTSLVCYITVIEGILGLFISGLILISYSRKYLR